MQPPWLGPFASCCPDRFARGLARAPPTVPRGTPGTPTSCGRAWASLLVDRSTTRCLCTAREAASRSRTLGRARELVQDRGHRLPQFLLVLRLVVRDLGHAL